MKESPFVAQQETDTIKILKKTAFFKHLDDKQISGILKLSRLRQFEPGETIIPEGVYDTYVYVLLGGEVEVHKNGLTITRLKTTGDIFGELAIINDEPRSASIEASVATSCLAIDAAFLESSMPKNQDTIFAAVYKIFAEIVSNRLRVTSLELSAAREENRRLREQLGQVPGLSASPRQSGSS